MLGKLHEGLAIDLSKLNQIRIRDGHVTVGLGVQFQDVIGPILEAGYEMQAVGSCEPVSVICATIGGGVGIFQGVLGLKIDALVSVRNVTAKGTVVEASSSTNSDLLWGMRGAGANFGVITSATYKLTEAPNGGRVFTADLMYGASQMAKYFDALKGLEDTMPAELAINIAITWDATANESYGTFVYSGPESDAREVLAPSFAINTAATLTSVVPYNEVPSVILFGMITALTAPRGIYGIYSTNLARFDIGSFNSAYKTFDAFYYKAYPNGQSSAGVLESFSNQAVAAVPTDATAYPWKASKGNLC
ncbi:FAD binding domain-containing protein [Seiridium cupressi]